MKRLTITPDEITNLKDYILDKFKDASKNDIEDFEVSKAEVKKHLAALDEDSITKPTVQITAETYLKMFQLVEQCNTEISWHGLVSRDKENAIYTLYHIMMFPQINSGVSTTTDETEFAEWQRTLIEDPDFPIEDLRLHGHSHVNMPVYSSGVDDKYQSDIIRKIEDGDYYIFMVLNKKHDICCFIYDYDQNILFETSDLSIKIINSESEDIIQEAATDIETYCKKEPSKGYTSYYFGNKTRSYYNENDDYDDVYPYLNNSGQFKRAGGRR